MFLNCRVTFIQPVLSGISTYGFSDLREWDKHPDCPAGACHFIITMWQRCLYTMDWLHTTAILHIHSMYLSMTVKQLSRICELCVSTQFASVTFVNLQGSVVTLSSKLSGAQIDSFVNSHLKFVRVFKFYVFCNIFGCARLVYVKKNTQHCCIQCLFQHTTKPTKRLCKKSAEWARVAISTLCGSV